MKVSDIIKINISLCDPETKKQKISTCFNGADKEEIYNDAIVYVCNKWNLLYDKVLKSFEFGLNGLFPSDNANIAVIQVEDEKILIEFFKEIGV